MLGSDDLFRWFDSRSSQCILCFRVPCDVATIAHFSPIVYGMMNSVRGELFLWYRDKDLQTVAPYYCRRSDFVTWSQAQKQHEKHGGLYKAWSFTCFLLSYGQYGTLSTSLFSFLRVIAHPAATHCNILWHSWPWCLKSIPHHDHAFKECNLSQDAPHPEWLQNQDVNKHVLSSGRSNPSRLSSIIIRAIQFQYKEQFNFNIILYSHVSLQFHIDYHQ